MSPWLSSARRATVSCDLRRLAHLGLEGGQELLKGLPGHAEVGL